MKVVCLGGGPGGLYFAISLKLRNPSHEITVIERNKTDDTFGWGVVLSDETLANLRANDPASADAIHAHFAYWDDISVILKGTNTVSTGHGFCGIGRKQMLLLLQDRCRELGITLKYETDVADIDALVADYDLVVAADGINSRVRTHFAEQFKPEIDTRACKFVWLGTHAKFDNAFTFIFEKTEHGWIWAHAYQFDKDTATFIVECAQDTFDKWGFAHMSQEESIATCERIFAAHLGGHSLMTNAKHIRGSAWINFNRVARSGTTKTWCCWEIRRPRRTSPSAPAPSWRWNRRSRWPSLSRRSRRWKRPSSAIRRTGGWTCCACNPPRAIRPSGSSRWRGTLTSTPCSSPIPC